MITPSNQKRDTAMETIPYDEQAVSSEPYPIKNYRLSWGGDEAVNAQDLIAAFQSYLAARDGYIPNTSGETWTADKQAQATGETVQKYGSQWIGHRVEDCSGAFVRAYKAHNLSIYHGSNRIAREYVTELLPPSAAQPGMAAFKTRKPGEKYYDLPSEYKQGGKRYNGDINDYYHIGLVDDDPRYVINAQGVQTGVVRSKLSDGWDYVARLKDVQYDEGSKEKMQRQVIGGKLNLREKPDKNSTRLTQIPDGAMALRCTGGFGRRTAPPTGVV